MHCKKRVSLFSVLTDYASADTRDASYCTCLSRVNTAAGNNINYIIANSFTYLNHIKLISCSCVSILYYACKEAPLSSK